MIIIHTYTLSSINNLFVLDLATSRITQVHWHFIRAHMRACTHISYAHMHTHTRAHTWAARSLACMFKRAHRHAYIYSRTEHECPFFLMGLTICSSFRRQVPITQGTAVVKRGARHVYCAGVAGEVSCRDPRTLRVEHTFEPHTGMCESSFLLVIFLVLIVCFTLQYYLCICTPGFLFFTKSISLVYVRYSSKKWFLFLLIQF